MSLSWPQATCCLVSPVPPSSSLSLPPAHHQPNRGFDFCRFMTITGFEVQLNQQLGWCDHVCGEVWYWEQQHCWAAGTHLVIGMRGQGHSHCYAPPNVLPGPTLSCYVLQCSAMPAALILWPAVHWCGPPALADQQYTWQNLVVVVEAMLLKKHTFRQKIKMPPMVAPWLSTTVH